MSTFVFSDTHFTKKFDIKLFNKLKELIEENDTIIINGDYWEGLAITFDEFLNSKWQKLFPILKSKNTIYIFGNHDKERFSDDRIYKFCNKACKEYLHITPLQKFYFTHGDEFLYPYVNKDSKDIAPASKKFEIYRGSLIQRIIFKFFGANAFPKRFNNMSLEKRKSITDINNLLICGHSHTPQHNKSLNFMDIGFFNYGWANYLIIQDNGDYKFHSERY